MKLQFEIEIYCENCGRDITANALTHNDAEKTFLSIKPCEHCKEKET